jgi:hypothetical protein
MRVRPLQVDSMPSSQVAFSLVRHRLTSNLTYAIDEPITNAIAAWLDSDAMRGDETTGAEDIITAHVIRYQILDVALHLLIELFGWRYAREHSVGHRRDAPVPALGIGIGEKL